MTEHHGHGIDALRTAIKEFSKLHKRKIRSWSRGERIIRQGDVSDEILFILDGELQVRTGGNAPDEGEPMGVRKDDLIGETAFLNRNQPRNANIYVFRWSFGAHWNRQTSSLTTRTS